jgi:hypothetical protein
MATNKKKSEHLLAKSRGSFSSGTSRQSGPLVKFFPGKINIRSIPEAGFLSQVRSLFQERLNKFSGSGVAVGFRPFLLMDQ